MELNLSEIIKKNLQNQLNQFQELALDKIISFIQGNNKNEIFLLKGYAGTGKTYIISNVVKNLWKIKKSVILLAPTGRSAKVISSYCNKEAFTVHKEIFFTKNNFSGNLEFKLKVNKHKNTLFVVDEASMISTSRNDGIGLFSQSLLDNIIKYVYSGFKCKLLIIGDTAQLPPVRSNISFALDKDYLEKEYAKEITAIELIDVVRQEKESGILSYATSIRNKIEKGFYDDISFNFDSFNDVVHIEDGEHLMNLIQESYNKFGLEETALIVRSNKRANLYNQAVRDKILNNDNTINVGDLLMVIKNNYFWLNNKRDIGFIANGDIIKIEEIDNIKQLYGFKFAEVKISMVDYPKIDHFETVLILDSLYINSSALDFNSMNNLYQEILKDYMNIKTKYKRHLAVKNNSFFNALQVKFAYSFTCHKSQGGQWGSIFLEFPYLPNGIDKDFLRWLYTAVTRAKNKLHLIGFNQ
ncbi:MAG: ATP-dependent endonuclease [Flavobacteriaceae bacterium]|nr:ATP-dependent endonuclease [Flavobacteriaceae bacterium]|tara:strand:+ start:523 stop:1929 length:1407 start_codon:yes stop_codon:yes gene_type:complete